MTTDGASRDYSGAALARLNAAAAAASQVFADAGFAAIEPGVIQQADQLLDLYGEDVRSRGFLFDDPALGELGLRIDFTVPICAMIRAGQAAPGRLRYAGPVFRRPDDGDPRPAQFHQVGAESFGEADAPAADAEIFALTAAAAQAAGVDGYDVETGDLGVIFGLIEGARIPARWKIRLKRHVWRPARFHALLNHYAHPDVDRRDPLLEALGALPEDQAAAAVRRILALSDAPEQGLRSAEDIAARILERAEDARERPIAPEIAALFDAALAVRGPSAEALAQLREIVAASGVAAGAALDRFEARLEALTRRGFDAAALPFDADFGRNLEYYDGFVFELRRPGAGKAGQIAGGGRYDQLAQAAGIDAPAVGCALRPESIIAGGAA